MSTVVDVICQDKF